MVLRTSVSISELILLEMRRSARTDKLDLLLERVRLAAAC